MLNVLVVDDSAVMRAMVIRTLRMSGLPIGEVHEAGDGRAGLELLDAEWIDLVMLDISMPVMRGEEMLCRIRANPATAALPVVVVTSERAGERVDALRAMGAEVVHKPFTPEHLGTTIRTLTGITDECVADGFAAAGSDLDF